MAGMVKGKLKIKLSHNCFDMWTANKNKLGKLTDSQDFHAICSDPILANSCS